MITPAGSSDAALPTATEGKSSTLRVVFVTEDDPLYVVRFFQVFFDEYPKDEIEIVGVSVQNAFGEPLGKTARRMWRFYGPFDFVRLGVRYAGVKARGVSIAALAEQHGLPLVPCASVNAAEYVERVRRLEPDVIASVTATKRAGARLMIDVLRGVRRGDIRATLLDWSQKKFGFRSPRTCRPSARGGRRLL